MSGILKNIIAIVGLLLVAALGYYLFVMNGDSTLTTNNAFVSSQADAETQEFLRRLNEIQQIEIDDTVLRSDTFRSLVDYSTPVESLPVGRPDPFARAN